MRSASAYFPGSMTVTTSDESIDQLFRTSAKNQFLGGTNFPALVSALWHRQPTGVVSILQAVSAPPCKGEMTVQVMGFDCLSAQQLDSIGHQFLAMPSFVFVSNAQSSSSLSLTIPVSYCSETSRTMSSISDLMCNLGKAMRGGRSFGFKSCIRIRAVGHSTHSSSGSSTNKDSVLAGRVRFEAIVPNMSFTVVQLHPIPVLATPLSKHLTNPAPAVITEASLGYVTMNQTRKLVFMLETDPSVSLVQMVGVWVQLPSAIAAHPTNSTSTRSSTAMDVHHPFVWAACVRYLSSDAVKRRVYVDTHTFLLVLLCGDQVQFFEVTLAPGGAFISSVKKMSATDAAGNNDTCSGMHGTEESAKAWLASESDFLCLDFTADLTADMAAQREEGLLCRFRPAETHSSFEARPEKNSIDDYNYNYNNNNNKGTSAQVPHSVTAAAALRQLSPPLLQRDPPHYPLAGAESVFTKQPFLPFDPAPLQPYPPLHQQLRHSNFIVDDNVNVHNTTNCNGSSKSLSRGGAGVDLSSSNQQHAAEEPSSQQMSVLTYQELSPRNSVPVPTPAPVSPAKARICPTIGSSVDKVEARQSCGQSQDERNSSFFGNAAPVHHLQQKQQGSGRETAGALVIIFSQQREIEHLRAEVNALRRQVQHLLSTVSSSSVGKESDNASLTNMDPGQPKVSIASQDNDDFPQAVEQVSVPEVVNARESRTSIGSCGGNRSNYDYSSCEDSFSGGSHSSRDSDRCNSVLMVVPTPVEIAVQSDSVGNTRSKSNEGTVERAPLTAKSPPADLPVLPVTARESSPAVTASSGLLANARSRADVALQPKHRTVVSSVVSTHDGDSSVSHFIQSRGGGEHVDVAAVPHRSRPQEEERLSLLESPSIVQIQARYRL